jgi:DNA modification methylase
MEKLKWKTEKRKVDELLPYEGNPRKMNEKQVEDLKKSLEKFDLVEIPAVNTDNKIVAGHQRLKIMQLLGRGGEMIDVRVPNRKLTDKEFREYLLRSNKNTGEFDYDLLANFDEEMLKEVGFLSEEMDDIFQLKADPKDDDVPEVKSKTDIKLGDMFQLGSHTLLCGDATKKEDVERLMGGERADMVFTDPPYNIGFSYNQHKDDMTYEDYKKFCQRFYELLDCERIVITPGPKNLYIWYEIMQIRDIGWAKEKEPSEEMYDEAIWYKKNARSGASCFHFRQCEPIVFFGKFKKKRNFDLFDYKRIISKELTEAQGGISKGTHAPGKPVMLVADIIKSFSNNGDTIKDVFGGNGTTLIACEKLNRKCRMMEISPQYCQVIIERWQNFTEKKAIKIK